MIEPSTVTYSISMSEYSDSDDGGDDGDSFYPWKGDDESYYAWKYDEFNGCSDPDDSYYERMTQSIVDIREEDKERRVHKLYFTHAF